MIDTRVSNSFATARIVYDLDEIMQLIENNKGWFRLDMFKWVFNVRGSSGEPTFKTDICCYHVTERPPLLEDTCKGFTISADSVESSISAIDYIAEQWYNEYKQDNACGFLYDIKIILNGVQPDIERSVMLKEKTSDIIYYLQTI